MKIGVAEPEVPNPAERFVTLWGSPLNVKVAIDLVLLTTGQLQVCGGAGICGTGSFVKGGGGTGGPGELCWQVGAPLVWLLWR